MSVHCPHHGLIEGFGHCPECYGEIAREVMHGLWPKIQTLERAAWSRKWSALKDARREIERLYGVSRPNDPLFAATLAGVSRQDG